MADIAPRPKGRLRKDVITRDMVGEQAYEIKRLRMENKLLRDFLQLIGSEAASKTLLKTEYIYRYQATTFEKARALIDTTSISTTTSISS